MKQFLSFVKKEFIHILRDVRSLLILLVMPIVMVLLLGYVVKTDVKDIRLAVLDPSHDTYTRLITERISSNSYFHYVGEINNENEATEKFRRGEVDLIVVFSPEFANRLMHTHNAGIQILVDGSEPNQASVRAAYAQQIIMGLQREIIEKMGVDTSAPRLSLQTFNIDINSRLLYNPQQRSEVNFVPGIIAMIMMLICCMMTSVAIVREREMGTMEILLASPLPSIVIVISKLIPYMVISLLNLASVLCITNFVMNIPMMGSWGAYILLSLIFVFTSLMLGLFISTCVSTQLAAMLLSLLLIVPSIYLSGLLFPIESMPVPAQVLSNLMPTKWFITASRKIMIEGVDMLYLTEQYVGLAAEGFFFLLLSWKFFKSRLA